MLTDRKDNWWIYQKTIIRIINGNQSNLLWPKTEQIPRLFPQSSKKHCQDFRTYDLLSEYGKPILIKNDRYSQTNWSFLHNYQ